MRGRVRKAGFRRETLAFCDWNQQNWDWRQSDRADMRSSRVLAGWHGWHACVTSLASSESTWLTSRTQLATLSPILCVCD